MATADDEDKEVQVNVEQEVEEANNDEENEASYFEEANNPFLIDHIIEKIFEYCSSSSSDSNDFNLQRLLQSYRTVCQAWNREACRKLEKNITVRLFSEDEVQRYLAHVDKVNCSTVAELSNFASLRHINYALYGAGRFEMEPYLEKFFKQCGTCVKTLMLQHGRIEEAALYSTLQNQIPNLETLSLRDVPLPSPPHVLDHPECWIDRPESPRQSDYSFPNIKHFTIGTHSFKDLVISFGLLPLSDENGNAIPRQKMKPVLRSLMKLISTFPNLETLTCTNFDSQPCDQNVSLHLLAALFQGHRNSWNCLRKLNFPLYISEEIADGISEAQLPGLESVGDVTFLSDVRASVASRVLEQISPRLRRLSLTFDNKLQSYPVRLSAQNMLEMKQLSLIKFGGRLDFLHHMKSLEKFECTDTELPLMFPSRITSETDLNELKIHQDGHISNDPTVLTRLGEAFPRLSVLHLVRIDDSCLYLIYLHFSYLKELACVDSTITDSGVTGISLEVCKDALETSTYMAMDPVELRQHLYIGNMSKLANLRLESPHLTYLSIFWGINACDGLQDVSLKLGVDLFEAYPAEKVLVAFNRRMDHISVVDWDDDVILKFGETNTTKAADQVDPEQKENAAHERYRSKAEYAAAVAAEQLSFSATGFGRTRRASDHHHHMWGF